MTTRTSKWASWKTRPEPGPAPEQGLSRNLSDLIPRVRPNEYDEVALGGKG